MSIPRKTETTVTGPYWFPNGECVTLVCGLGHHRNLLQSFVNDDGTLNDARLKCPRDFCPFHQGAQLENFSRTT